MIFEAIIMGIGLGLFLAIQPGPSFFALIETSSKKGFKSGMAMASGIFLSDVFLVVLSYLGIAQLFDNPENKKIIALVGGTILVGFGAYSIFNKKKVRTDNSVEVNGADISLYVTKGFFLNILNPSVFLLWIFYIGLVTSNESFTALHVALFFIATLSTVLSTDLLKSYYSDRISQRLSPIILENINLLLGGILVIVGLVFLYKSVFAYG